MHIFCTYLKEANGGYKYVITKRAMPIAAKRELTAPANSKIFTSDENRFKFRIISMNKLSTTY